MNLEPNPKARSVLISFSISTVRFCAGAGRTASSIFTVAS